MLDHIGVRPDSLVRITRKPRIVVLEETVRIRDIVLSGNPAWTVARGATDLSEKFLAFDDLRIVQIPGRRNSQPSVPDHKVGIFLIRHLRLEILGHQIIINILLNIPRLVLVREIFVEILLDIRILRSHLGVGRRHIVVTPVASGHVGDVPDGVRSGGVLQRATAQRVSETLRMGSLAVKACPLAICEYGRIQFGTSRLLLGVLRLEIIVINRVQKPDSINADRGLNPETHV